MYQKRKALFIRSFKDKPCHDCGQTYPHWIMEFDHSRGEKLFTLGSASNRSYKQILDEIKKCDIVCANCHADRTYKRKQSPMV